MFNIHSWDPKRPKYIMIKYKILELKLYDFSIKDLEKHKNLVNKNLIPP